MKTYKVDLDYESFLFNPAYDENQSAFQKINKEFEYVFFLVNKEACRLKNVRSYDELYLKEMKRLGFVIPEFAPNENQFQYWWGKRKDLELEKKLNSKMTSVEIAKKHGWGFHEGEIVSNFDEVERHLQKFPQVKNWIIKRPHSFSGIGHYYFEAASIDKKILEKILIESVLLEPVYQRVFDIGTTFEISNGVVERQFMVENFNSKTGGFKGGAGASDVGKFKKYIDEKYGYSLDDLENITKKIGREYLEMGAKNNIQIDSFVYLEDGELKLYPLVEVNYRKTMGLVIQSLADRNVDTLRVEWRVFSHKEEVKEDLEGWVKVSAEGGYFRSYFRFF